MRSYISCETTKTTHKLNSSEHTIKHKNYHIRLIIPQKPTFFNIYFKFRLSLFKGLWGQGATPFVGVDKPLFHQNLYIHNKKAESTSIYFQLNAITYDKAHF